MIFRKLAQAACAALISVCACLTLFASGAFASDDFDAVEAVQTTLTAIESQDDGKGVLLSGDYQAGDDVSDWIAFELALCGLADSQGGETYLANLEDYVTNAYGTSDKLDSTSATVWQHAILVIEALGGDPTAFGTDANGNPINLVADGTYSWSQTKTLGTQGTNAYIYALLALDSMDYQVPAGAAYTRESIIREILDAQEDDGSFGLTSGDSNLDITAMALQSLAPYIDQPQVKSAVDKALDWLADQQRANGSFALGGTENSESCAQVILALTALGIDPRTDTRFTQGFNTPVTALMSFQRDDGAFMHEKSYKNANDLATEQALLALLSIVKFDNGGGSVFDLTTPVASDLDQLAPQSAVSPVVLVAACIIVVIAIIVIIAVIRVRKKGKKQCVK